MKLIRSLRVAVLLAATVGPAQAEPPSPPPFYAITNVQVVTGTGQTLEDSTVLIADGLIEEVSHAFANIETLKVTGRTSGFF